MQKPSEFFFPIDINFLKDCSSIEAFSKSCSERSENSEIINDLMTAVTRFEREQADDQTVVLIRCNE